MSSPSISHEDYSSFTRTREDELDNSSLNPSYELNNSFTEGRQSELAIDKAIAGLKKCLQHYEEKAQNCENQLENLGFTVKDLPEDLLSDLKETFKDDDGVFSFPRDSGEMVRINPDHVLDSLQQQYELGRLRMLAGQIATLVEEFGRLRDHLESKLNTEKEESEKLENKQFDKEANLIIFNEKLKAAMGELKNLQQLSQGNQKPKYSLDELENLKQEVNQLKSAIAFTNTKLKRYNKLPLSEKDALKQLVKMKEDLKALDDEIKEKVSY